MTTRRTTRRSTAISGNENDLAARGVGPQQAGALGKKVVGADKSGVPRAKPVVLITKSANAAGTSDAKASGVARKRPAFADVTNGTAKASTSSKPKPTVSKQVVPTTTTTRRRIGTRSSTGGIAQSEDDVVKSEIKSEEDDFEYDNNNNNNNKQQHDEDDAMNLDDDVPVPSRAFKALPKASASVVATKPRAALASKSTNTSRVTTATKKPTTAVKVTAAQRRRRDAELAMAAAVKELEEAEEEEAEAKARSKRLKTSEPDFMGDLVDDVEDEDVEDESKYGAKLEKDEGWEDLDAGDEDDPLMVTSYVVEVYDYLKELELTTMPEANYMTKQLEVTWKMRGILIDWLVEIHTKFRLLPETIFLAVNIVDRFLSAGRVSLVKFQLVGVTALFIASKYEEVTCPSVTNFLYMTDGGYEDDEILKAERYILKSIDFNLSYPNPINFLRRISKADGYDIQSRTMAKYFMEISIVDHKFMGVTPSLIAAAGNWLARRVLMKGHWDANLVHYSGYTEDELKPTAQLMLDYVVRSSSLADAATAITMNPLLTALPTNEPEHPNFIKKYAAKKFFKASTAVRKWAEAEYAPIEFINKTTRRMERKMVPALL